MIGDPALDPDLALWKCPACNGVGRVWTGHQRDTFGHPGDMCWTCQGSGRHPDAPEPSLSPEDTEAIEVVAAQLRAMAALERAVDAVVAEEGEG